MSSTNRKPSSPLAALLVEAGRSETAPDRSVRRAIATAGIATSLSTAASVASASAWALGAAGAYGKAFAIGVVMGGLTLLAGHVATTHPPPAREIAAATAQQPHAVSVRQPHEGPKAAVSSTEAAPPQADQAHEPTLLPLAPTPPNMQRIPSLGGLQNSLETPQTPQLVASSSTSQTVEESGVKAPRAESLRKSDELARELAMLDKARTWLVSGNAPAALAAIQDYQAAYPRGRLGVETAVLRIEALVALGRREEARGLARQFLAAYPRSALSQRVRTVSALNQ